MTRRKTIEVAPIIDKINFLISRSVGEESRNERSTLMCLAEKILHESGNYKGFRYIDLKPEHYELLAQGAYFRDLGVDDTRVHYL